MSTGQGLLTVFAAECAAAGMSLANTRKAIEKRLPLTRGFALVKDLSFAVRGGRVPGYVKPAAERLRITPIIRTLPDGRITSGGFLLGRQRRLRRFARHIVRHSVIDGATHIAIGHALCADEARELRAILEALIPDVKRATITELGSMLGVHGGPGTLAVATMPDRV